MIKRLQNRIAESRFALTTTVLLCLPVWGIALLHAADPLPIAISMGCVALSTFLMAELNNTYALIRIYSRMVSCIFLLLMTMACYPYEDISVAVTALCSIFFYTASFHCYQESHQVGWGFYAFLAVGINSLFFVQVLYFVPLLWILLLTKLLAMSPRMFFASLLGLLTPYWFYLFYALWQQDLSAFADHFIALGTFVNPMEALPLLTMPQMINGGMVLFCALTGMVHYLRNRQQDRIRTQLLYELMMIVDAIAILFLLAQPQHFDQMLPLVIVNTAPLAAHFTALTHTRWTNMLMKAMMLLLVLITLYNIVLHSPAAALLPNEFTT